MKKTKLLISFVVFCIVLSFFSMALADGHKIEFVKSDHLDADPTEGGPISTENTFTIKTTVAGAFNAGHRQTLIKCNQTGVYTIKITNTNGNPSSDYSVYRYYQGCDWRDVPGTQFASLAAYKDGDSYTTFSPRSTTYDTTVKVYLYAGQEYMIDNWDREGTLEISYSTADNSPAKEVYDSGFSSRNTTKVNYGSKDVGSAPVTDGVPSGAKVTSPKAKATVAGAETENKFEKYFVRLLLSIGDFFLKLLGDIVGSDVTITKIIYNGADENTKIPALNPNLFDASNRSALAGIDLSEVISDWFNFFRVLAFTFYIVTLLGIGIHVLLNCTGQGWAKAKTLLIEWSKGVLLLLLMPVFIKFLFQLNEALVKTIYEQAANGVINGENNVAFTDGSEWSLTAIEFRSPEFVSSYTGTIALGSEEATTSYIKSLKNYKDNFDLMRICRAYAGATWRLGYTIIWYILIGQLLVFVVMYYKRYFTILFLIAAFPVICMFHAISLIRGMNKTPEITNWLKKLIEQIFVQAIHAVIYAIITGTCMALFRQSIQGNGTVNWLLMIVAINFVPEGEKVLKRILSKIGGSGGMAESAKGIKGAIGRVTGQARKLIGMSPKE